MWHWIDDRWHLDGKPVHAGTGLEICWPDGTWERVRVESAAAGHKLYAHFEYHGLELCVRVDANGQDATHNLRWPQREGSHV